MHLSRIALYAKWLIDTTKVKEGHWKIINKQLKAH